MKKIMRKGWVNPVYTNSHPDRIEIAKSLFGILPKDADLKLAKEERLDEK